MEVIIVKPFGYCEGVTKAILLAKKAAKESVTRVFMLGLLVHNEETVKELESLGITILDEKKASIREHLLSIPSNSTIIFSAHGHSKELDDIAKDKHLQVYDATCHYVSENLKTALNYDDGIIYVGSKGHLESDAFLQNYPNALFYDVKSKSFCNDKTVDGAPLILGQTTLSKEEIEEANQEIMKSFPLAKIGPQRCHSTSSRQEAILSLDESIKDIIVLGSKLSNNSLKLAEIAKRKGMNTHLCLCLEEVKKLNLSNIKKIALCSGASTSRETFLEVKDYLLSL